jgi:hypothetical protein
MDRGAHIQLSDGVGHFFFGFAVMEADRHDAERPYFCLFFCSRVG